MANKVRIDFKFRKLRFYLKGVIKSIIPRSYFQYRLKSVLATLESHDSNYINDRVNYYNKFAEIIAIEPDSICYKQYTLKGLNSTYYFDFKELIRHFDDSLQFHILFGDIHWLSPKPAFLKSRPISDENQNSVLLKLDKLRHFYFAEDQLAFTDKKNVAVFRGPCYQQHRQDFIFQSSGVENTDIGDTRPPEQSLDHHKPYMTVQEQLEHKFIISVEGNDVATNLKWIMSSNSLCFMRKPRFETWYMEGRLIPNFHYVLLHDDYSNLDEMIKHYTQHPNEALEIIKNANEYTQQFQDEDREQLISLLVLKKYQKR